MSYCNCNILVLDNFYDNPDDVREFALNQTYNYGGYYPGKRTMSFANDDIKNKIQQLITPYFGNIIDFYNQDNVSNCSFQITTENDKSWIHHDMFTNAGILFLTPNYPVSAGIGFYRHISGIDEYTPGYKIPDGDSRDITKWELVDYVGNKYNRLVLFNAKRYHSAVKYYGNNDENGRLFQMFFFNTE